MKSMIILLILMAASVGAGEIEDLLIEKGKCLAKSAHYQEQNALEQLRLQNIEVRMSQIRAAEQKAKDEKEKKDAEAKKAAPGKTNP